MDREQRRAFRLDRGPDDARWRVDEELEHHLELAAAELREEGWSPEEARREAERRFGDLEGTQAYCTEIQRRRGRVEGRTRLLDELRQNLTYGIRSALKAPGYSALVVLTLAFGIAAATTIFSLMNPYFFRPLPYGEAEELVHLQQVDPVTGWDRGRFSLPTVEDWRERNRAFEGLAGYTYGGANLTGSQGAEAVTVSRVTPDMLDVLRVQPALGRGFRPGDGGPGADPVVLLSHGLWERRYLADPGVLGRSISVDGVAHTMVGVMPPEFVFPFNGIGFWTPIRESVAEASRRRASYLMVGRLSPGWTRERADEHLTALQAELGALHPDADGQWEGVTVLGMREALNFGWDVLRLSFGVLLAAVAFVLAIACVNVASLTLARAGTRLREVSVRTAMGASRSRIVRQLLTESLVLALAGGALGVGLAHLAVGFVGPVLPPDLFRVGEATIDGTVLALSTAVTLATPLLFGLAPALTTTRRDLTRSLGDGGRASAGLTASRGRKALVAVQVALAVILLTGAGLMVRSLAQVQEMDLGFEADRVLSVLVRPPEVGYDAGEILAYTEAAVTELEAVPGVASASATLFIPLNHETAIRQFARPEMAGTPAEEWPVAILNRAWPGYFRAMGIPLLTGRDFHPSDDGESAPVVVVDETLAHRYGSPAQAVGRTLLVGDPGHPLEATIVGVVGSVRHESLNDPQESLGQGGRRPQLYQPLLQAPARRHFLVASTDGDPDGLAGPVRRTLTRLDPDLPLSIRPLEGVVQENQLQWSMGSAFMSVFGAGALLLAALGIYGLIAFSVTRRSRELGIRLALGATPGELRTTVVRDALGPTLVGLGVGLALALALARVTAATLYGVSPFDPPTLAAVLLLFLATATLAALVPAARASRTDPMVAMRSE